MKNRSDIDDYLDGEYGTPKTTGGWYYFSRSRNRNTIAAPAARKTKALFYGVSVAVGVGIVIAMRIGWDFESAISLATPFYLVWLLLYFIS